MITIHIEIPDWYNGKLAECMNKIHLAFYIKVKLEGDWQYLKWGGGTDYAV